MKKGDDAHLGLSGGAPSPHPRHLLRRRTETGPLPVAVGGLIEGVFRHVLRLLHQLRRVHGLHGDDVEGVQVLQEHGGGRGGVVNATEV